jgi:DNA (cytosine-5)-methyltransferase 1
MRVVSLFSGAGGLDLGFQRAGHEVVWANDHYHDAVETYKRNIGYHVTCEDIEKVPSSQIPECDIVIGGFPCQGFSVANWNRTACDDRNSLYLEMLRVVKDKKPSYFLAENVKGLVSMEKGQVLRLIIADFEKAGYDISWAVLNSADYGVPQMRMRVFIAGTRRGIEPRVAMPPYSSHCDPRKGLSFLREPWVSVSQALAGIGEPGDSDLPNHTCSRYKINFSGYLGHRPLDPDKPAPTVTARGDERGGVVVLPHPNGKRRMTVRELATVQSFPKDFVFCGTQTSGYRQVGNAVPPLLAEAVARAFPVIPK